MCAALGAAAFACSSIVSTTKTISVPGNVEVTYPADFPVSLATAFGHQVAAERERVRAWWGNTFKGTVRVHITDDVRVGMSLVPAWRGDRGEIDMPPARVRKGDAASLHELVHVYAPNANRMLAEGLAVDGQDLLVKRPIFPTYGRPLHAQAAAVADQFRIVSLERLAVPKFLAVRPYRRAAYLIAGSFVRFLIERYGMDKFRALYALTPLKAHQRYAGDPERWQTIYGKPLTALEREWRAFLRQYRS